MPKPKKMKRGRKKPAKPKKPGLDPVDIRRTHERDEDRHRQQEWEQTLHGWAD